MAEALTRIVEDTGATVAATVVDSAEALAIGSRLCPDVAVVDLSLSPDCDVVSSLHKACPETRIIILADREGDETEGMVKALASGAVGAMYKEAPLESLTHALQTSTRSTPALPDEAAGVLLNSYVETLSEKRDRDLATIEALAAAVEARDTGTGRHLRRVTELARSAMDRIDSGLANNEEVSYGFLLHDVGKVGIPDAVLNKPGPLDADEWSTMREHPEIGLRIVSPIGFSSAATDVILCHHERFDGTGYPRGLKNDEIPLTARVFSIADAYDAMTSDRPYRSAMPMEEALDAITAESGGRYDPELVDEFVALAG